MAHDGDDPTGRTALDLDMVRAQFPAFEEPSLQGWIHAQNAGGSYACRQVIDLLTTFYRTTKLQGGDHFPAGAAAIEAMSRARPGLARWLGVGEDEIHIGPSTSQNTVVLAAAFGEVLARGDAVVVTNQDHEANSGAWRRLADRGIEVREWRVDPTTGRLSLDGLDMLLDDDVALVAFPHVSNIVGEVNPVTDIAARAHAVDAVAVCDGVAAAPHGLPDVGALGVDVYLFSTYKTFGPHQGVMVVRRDLADRLPNQGHFFNADAIHLKFLPAGPDHAQVAATAGVVDYLDELADHHAGTTLAGPAHESARRQHLGDLVGDHERDLMVPILEAAARAPGVTVLGPTGPEGRVPTISLACERDPTNLAIDLAARGVMAAAGHFYAWRLVDALGLDPERGVLRLSLVHSTTREEAAAVASALEAVV
jgi:selenocysteine lyase/cysteine desulfurase